MGFAGVSVALGDVDGDESMEVAVLTGEGKLAIIEADGTVGHLSTDVVDGATNNDFGWGGGLSIGDMDGDGWAEIAYGRTVFTMNDGALSLLFKGAGGYGSGPSRGIAHFVDLDDNGTLELLAGNTAYTIDGTPLWSATISDGFTAVADFDNDDLPEVVVVSGGNLYVLEGSTGVVEIGPHNIPGNGSGGPPTVADFNGDDAPEIGVAMQNFYAMMKPDYDTPAILDLWTTQNHDNSSSVTGSSVFDFEGDGKAEVVYADECFLWVYDGTTGDIIYTANSQSFTATEAPVVADVDGDGHAEMLVVHNGANPNTWTCAHHTTGMDGYPIWSPPAAGAYRGVTVYGDSANSWVSTRTLWNQHAYSVSNICDPRDGACIGTTHYGQIPTAQQKNWTVSWLNNFRQNVQDSGLFDAPDPVVSVDGSCGNPVELEISVRNIGRAALPAGVDVHVFVGPAPSNIGTVTTTQALFPGQSQVLEFVVDSAAGGTADTYLASIYVDPMAPTFHECRPENNTSNEFTPSCVD
ncbi:MAG: VCBS repeat-containing protein [Myxococcales bacterium]|nr:VCBS repeat-containing protein [Myxococcales bacterium]